MKASNLEISVVDNSISVAEPLSGIIFTEGITLRGPVNNPEDIITSERQFKLLFGGTDSDSLFPLLCLEMLSRGAKLRVNRITDGTEAIAASGNAVKSALALFSFTAKYAGADYNHLKVDIQDASNGNADYFNLVIYHETDTLVREVYTNLTIPGTPTIAESHYLDDILANSKFVVPLYKDTSSGTAPLRPTNATLSFTSGTNGGTADLADYTGDKTSKTGFFAFDDYDDSYMLVVPELSDTDLAGLAAAGEEYASTRGDLMFLNHLDNTNLDTTDLISERGDIDSAFILHLGGGLKMTHPVSSEVIEIPETAHVAALIAKIHDTYGPWRSFFGPTFGVVKGTLGVVNNFGTPAGQADLDILVNNQINMMVKRNGSVYLSDAITSQVAESSMSFAATMFMIFYVKKALYPVLSKYLGYPNHFKTWKALYYVVKPFLDKMVANEAWFSYEWLGDQFVTSMNNLQVNDPADVLKGKYKARLKVVNVAPLREFELEISLNTTTGSASIELID